MATIQLPSSPAPSAGGPRPRPQLRVMVRKNWSDPWKECAYMQPMSCDDAAGPTKPRATFKWMTGQIKYEDQHTYSNYVPVDYRDRFVRIDLLSTGYPASPLWYGRFTDESFNAAGSDNGQLGDETLTAYGLAHELDRSTLRGSYVTNDQSTAIQIRASIPFNLDFVRGFSELGNRSAAKIAVPASVNIAAGSITSAYALSGQQTSGSIGSLPTRTGTPWSVADILEYLLAFHGSSEVPFRLGGQLDALKSIVLPKVRIEGHTVLQMLNTLIDRRRGLGWCLKATDDAAEVQIFTSLEKPVSIDDSSVPANANQQSIDVDSYGHIIDRVQTTFDTRAKYGRIIVSGERLVSCFTVSFQDGNLIPAWTPAEQSSYLSGSTASNATPKQHDEARERDALAHVWTTYLIDEANWNWKVGDGQGGDAQTSANLAVYTDGTLNTSGYGAAAAVRNWGHQLLRSLPILKSMSRDGSHPEYREPLCLIYDRTSNQYVHLHKAAGEGVAGHLRMLDKDFGIQAIMHPAHLLALGSFDAAAGTQKKPLFDYRAIIATVAARTDEKVEVTVDIPGGDISRCLMIEVSDAEVWTIAKGTVLDVNESGQIIRQPSVQVVRDDSSRLRQIAALAKAWYGIERSTLHLSVKDIWQQFPIGAMIRSVDDPFGNVPINTVVSRVAWDLQTMSTTLDTSYAELDVKWTSGPARHTLR